MIICRSVVLLIILIELFFRPRKQRSSFIVFVNVVESCVHSDFTCYDNHLFGFIFLISSYGLRSGSSSSSLIYFVLTRTSCLLLLRLLQKFLVFVLVAVIHFHSPSLALIITVVLSLLSPSEFIITFICVHFHLLMRSLLPSPAFVSHSIVLHIQF